MTEWNDRLAETFEESVLAAVAADHGHTVEELRTLVRRHQSLAARLPGVENLVYEWRKQFPNDPVVERREEAYYLSVAEGVWPEYAEALSLSAAEERALRAVHRKQLAAVTGGRPTGERGAMVLVRGFRE